MRYEIDASLIKLLLPDIVLAEDGLARLDERAQRSSVAQGFAERGHFFDAVGAMWVAGELVHVEDLVLHDAHMDSRAPSHELTIAHAILRARRRMWTSDANWSLTRAGLAVLSGAAGYEQEIPRAGVAKTKDDEDTDALLSAELAEIDAVLERSTRLLDEHLGKPVLDQSPKPAPSKAGGDPMGLFDDEEWDEASRLHEWCRLIPLADTMPCVLGAALLFEGWEKIEPLRRQHWLGGLLVSSYLRARGKVTSHLFSFHAGLRAVRHELRRAKDRRTRLQAFLQGMTESAALGLKEMDRLSLAHTQMELRFKDRRSNSSLPELADFILSRPIVSSAMVAKELGVTSRGALNLLNDIGVREITGRGRYRAWGII
ncbi:DUF1612 domain-containing protein (plasmid) [Rhizobium grahamii]|uniref:DUF1612 domain-containing protein n=1 Tax=Rhizobium grahamii TaxID=1120045 RepID=A0A5Q0CAZ1_9HYPH|nr:MULTISPECIES: RHE_PE00001 family protein [Rhizobium]QFY62603.1 DUF1612 domain-containing protein [Rhizobium grahamii]QRM52657.1 DUF1612 domain-containing protein [Rhizobium sp. BG6]